VADALVYLRLRLNNRLTHFLCHEAGILCLVFRKDLLQVAQLLKATLDACQALSVFVAEALVGAIDKTLKLLATDSLESPMQLVVLRIY